MLFHDRKEAGACLAEALLHYRDLHPVIVGLPRGGIPVAAEIARRLSAPLDLIVARKIGCPWQPEFAIGAIAPGVTVLNDEEIRALGIRPDQIEGTVARERRELERREAVYRKGRQPRHQGAPAARTEPYHLRRAGLRPRQRHQPRALRR